MAIHSDSRKANVTTDASTRKSASLGSFYGTKRVAVVRINDEFMCIQSRSKISLCSLKVQPTLISQTKEMKTSDDIYHLLLISVGMGNNWNFISKMTVCCDLMIVFVSVIT